MRRATGTLLVLTVAITISIFILLMSFIIDILSKKAHEQQAVKIYKLVVFTLNENDGVVDHDYIYKLAVDAQIRISIIGLDGSVLIDSKQESTDGMSSHSDREEFVEALEGDIGVDIRRSESFNIDYLYVAGLIENSTDEIFVLRIAVEVNSIYSYLFYLSIASIAVLLFLIIITHFLSKPITTKLLKPFELVRLKLESALKSDVVVAAEQFDQQKILTKYDDINIILSDIDIVSSKIIEYTEQINNDKEKLDLILENIESAVALINRDGLIQSCNKLALIYFNIPGSNSINIRDYIRITDFHTQLDNSILGNKCTQFDIVISGGRILEIHITPISNQIMSIIITGTDVTHQRQLADSKQAFFENAGHELNTPLSSILGYSEILLEHETKDTKFLKIINTEALRMKTLINDMLKISELETNVPFLDVSFDLSEIIQKIIDTYTLKALLKDIKIHSSLISVYIYSDPEKLGSLVSNLIDNSIKYNNKGGRVDVTLLSEKDQIILKVEDNGIGIPEQYLNRLFERFFRVDKGRSRIEGGTGLGLSIVKHIADRIHAVVSIDSKVNIGTTITVRFNKNLNELHE
ncbi:MAG: hypothetical protein LBF68_01900 [Christensenellaceae bacterium]|jgi:two-component system phosphate regulon sensor histidine kinase PhoR|nr:hypothetical protein [Christensenellaceae bacterium]